MVADVGECPSVVDVGGCPSAADVGECPSVVVALVLNPLHHTEIHLRNKINLAQGGVEVGA